MLTTQCDPRCRFTKLFIEWMARGNLSVALLAAILSFSESPLRAEVLFKAPLSFDVGTYASSVAVGDLNGDLKPDLAVANFYSNSVSVLLGNGDGTFETHHGYGTGDFPTSVAIGDLSGDQKPDLAVANSNSSTVSVLLGNGDGTFGERTDYGTGSGPGSVAIDDLNGDQKPDLSVANGGSNTVSILLGNGDGTFGERTDYGTGSSPGSVAIDDLNGDQKPDLAVANYSSSTVSVLLGNGDGTFGPKNDNGTGSGPGSVAVGDLNGDQKPDLAVANFYSNSVSVLLGNGDGTFGTKNDNGTGSGPSSVAIDDLNGDQKPDLAVVNFNSHTVSVLLGNGDGSFGMMIDYRTGGRSVSIAIRDLDGDQKADLAVTTGPHTASVLLGNGDGTFGTYHDYGTGSGPCSVAVGDLNADQKPDLAVANFYSNSVSVLLGNGDGTFGTKNDNGTGVYPTFVAIGDLSGDQKPDLAVANSNSSTVSVLLGNGDGTFGERTDYGTGSGPGSVAIDDLNGDQKPDLSVANGGSNTVSILLGNGDGTFGERTDYGTGSSPGSVAIDDLNGDQKPDLAVANFYSNSVSVLLGNGDGTFETHHDYGTVDGATSVAIGDLNGDQKPDLAVANSLSNTVSVLLGNGDGTFGETTDYGTGFYPAFVAIGDLNGDQKSDLAVANGFDLDTTSVLLNIATDSQEGACCYVDGHCDYVTQAACPTGDWRAETACDPNPCPPYCWPYALSYADFDGIDRTSTLAGGQLTLGLFASQAGTASLNEINTTCAYLPGQEFVIPAAGCGEVSSWMTLFPTNCSSILDVALDLELGGQTFTSAQRVVVDYPILSEDDLGPSGWGVYGTLQGLLQAFAPVLKFHDGEPYLPVSVDVSLYNATLRTDGPGAPSPLPPALDDSDLSKDDLARYSWRYFTLDIPGDKTNPDGYRVVYEEAIGPDPEYIVYATAIRDRGADWNSDADDLIILQYWMNYYINDYETATCVGGVPKRYVHEGDWESVSVALDTSLRCLGVRYGGHRPDNAIASEGIWYLGTKHPVVYVAKGSHANYKKADGNDCAFGYVRECHGGNGAVLVPPGVSGGDQYRIQELPRWAKLRPSSDEWVEFSGYWGTGAPYHGEDVDFRDAVWRGPAFRENWVNPGGEEFGNLVVTAASPVDLVVRDPLGRVAGPDTVTIPMARYEVTVIDSLGVETHRSPTAVIPYPVAGEYHVDVLPLRSARSSETYSLWSCRQWIGERPDTTLLAVDVPIEEIPPEGYSFVPDVPHVGRSELVPTYWNLDWEPDDEEPIEWHLTSPDGLFDVGDLIPDSLRLNGTVEPILPVTIQGGTLVVRFPRGPAVHSITDGESVTVRRVLVTGIFTDSLWRLESPATVWLLATAGAGERSGGGVGLVLEFPSGNIVPGPVVMRLSLPSRGYLRVIVVDVAGRSVAELADGVYERGAHELRWNPGSAGGMRVAAGIYFVRAVLDGRSETRRLVVVH